ncbi:MAG: biopolymer transporter ExbD [Planctomycetaceae bacterium]|nr:biopolymer transporter ExbD [Planctomycetaceae bacterium]
MKFRHPIARERIELQMTPMIDIVFLLLIFFIMTFKIVAQEGDFNIKMPLAAPNTGAVDDSLLPPLKLRLIANPEGLLVADGIQLNDRVFADFNGLHAHIRSLIGDDAGAGSVGDAEIEIDADYQLRYNYVIDAVTAVSGYIDQDDNVVKLIEKIKFTPPKEPPAS